MKSLFARIWLSYWVMMAVTIAAALAITFGLAVKRARDAGGLTAPALALSAQAALTGGGRDGLDSWIVAERHARPELSIYFVEPDGREWLNRPITGARLPGMAGAAPPRIVGPNGMLYRMVVRRSPGLAFGIWQVTTQPLVLLVLAIAVSGSVCAWLAHHLTRPVVGLRDCVRALADGRLDTRMDGGLMTRRDELGGLARDVDRMAAALSAVIGAKDALLRDVSHELRTPLTRLRLAAALARRGAPDENVAEFERIDREVGRIDAMIGQILRFSRLTGGPAPVMAPLDLAALVEEVVEDGRLEAGAGGTTIALSIGARPILAGDAAMLRSAIENVLRNALRFTPPGGAVGVGLAVAGDAASIAIEDEGPGIAESELARIFEPFFHADRHGAGLGLAIAARVAAIHGGRIVARNRAGGGLRVEITLPAGGGAPRDR